ncbi:hypothetical protein SAMN06265365_11792 [Tistlia consotensis]|uniref:Uncharacterized protein n=1 Tax=Tistlia consotensis USBA 355 TaxID=560819 RepID=A0A1Y6C9Y9_9PROT|nr:hypothetical protein [Tistlia consotensis]SMF51403.1 hypothetical protein SAMN05428998_11827 [Tistlia consotensis USBA 355]SNR84381.1 hypothetical protein SAMN06265365_11792 [Tistlia consotensis]
MTVTAHPSEPSANRAALHVTHRASDGPTDRPSDWERPKGAKPTPPGVPGSFLLVQFWRDIFGKEVQSAATYSYLWMADQMGHIAIGLLVQVVGYFVFNRLGTWVPGLAWLLAWANGLSFLLVSGVVSFWEFRAYSVSRREAANLQFPLDNDLLRRNAVIAAVYMIIGALVGYDVNLRTPGAWTWFWNVVLFLGAMGICVAAAPPWLRQKIVWQKAALPYLARLADLRAQIDEEVAEQLRRLIAAPFDSSRPRQIMVVGPIGSGRTPMVCGLGTELAFKGKKVRYCSFDTLMEISDQYDLPRPDGLPPMGSWGPKNIYYWPWFEAETLIIDDISPIISTAIERFGPQAFTEILDIGLKQAAGQICNRNTVWVFGADEKDVAETRGVTSLDELIRIYARGIQDFCRAEEPPLIVHLPRPAASAG